ncbi:MAG: AMP-binding protein [Acidobacteriota bacterium]|nr:AMP-binding protein [Acidobacteriota bacterium]
MRIVSRTIVPDRNTVVELLRGPASSPGGTPALLGLGRRSLSRSGLMLQIEDVSRSLRAAGVRSGDRVAVCLPDGPEMATAFLGICSAVPSAPLNPAYREEEFVFFLSDLEARALVLPEGVESPARQAAHRLGIPVLDLVSDPETAGLFRFSSVPPSEEALAPAASGDVALLLHTSGTTARPKLVALTHRNLCASAGHIARTLELTEADRCLNVMPLFHIHGLVAALLASLSAGASVVCTPGFQAPSFFDWMDQFEPSWYTAVPTMHQAILARAPGHAPVLERRRLRFLRSSSAALPPQVSTELERVFRAPLIEAYGMTEASHQMASNPLPPRIRKPGTVGPAAGPDVAILDEGGKILAPGVRGEVAIRGPNVTAGYVNNSEANERAFTNGWFRTGDQGSLDTDGYLTLTGRLKEIINRGGEKISPREIDEVLLDHPAIAQAVAFAIPDSLLGEDVGAAVVLRDGRSATPGEIREFVSSRLADFKVPRRVIIVSEIPKGPTGKVQRIGLAEKLGQPGTERPSGDAESVSPRTPLEEKLVSVWREVLRIDRIGVTQDFFSLGGDSVLAAQVAARIQSSLGVQLSLVAIFDAPTIAELAGRIEARTRDAAGDGEAIPRRSADAKPVLSFAQEQIWFHEHLDPGLYNRATNLRIRGPVDRKAFERAFSRILERHEILRTSYPSDDGTPFPAVSPRIDPPFAFRDLGDLRGSDRETEILRMAQAELDRQFDLERGPLIRAVLLRLDDSEHIVLVTAHHIVFDRWSVGVFVSELGTLHEAFSRGAADPLESLPVQFEDFAQWERARLPGIREGLLWYWKSRLAGAAALELPIDHAYREDVPRQFGHHSLRLSEQILSQLGAVSRSESASLFMTLLAAYQALLFTRSGQTDVVVVTNSANRGRIETESLIGFLADLIVFRTDLSGNPPFLELLARVRGVALAAYRHQDLPFATLIQGVRPARVPGRIPFARSLIALNTRLPSVTCGGTTFEPSGAGEEAARFDLSLFLETGDDGLTGLWKYDTNLFESGTVASLSRDYEELLARVVKDPQTRLEALRALLARRPPSPA